MNTLKSFLVTFIATAGGSGYAPKAPGTAGTVVGVFIIYLTRDWPYSSQLVLWTALFFAGWWASWEWSKKTGAKDNQQIVIDEVLGYMLAMGMLPREGWILITQFILFRIFDALKPPPIRQFDQWGKKFEIGAAQSLGIIVDDLLAGVVSLLVFYLLQYFMVQSGFKI